MIANIVRITFFIFIALYETVSFKRNYIMRCPSYPNINQVYNYTYGFKSVDSVLCNNYRLIINDKKKRNLYLRLRENMVNRNVYM